MWLHGQSHILGATTPNASLSRVRYMYMCWLQPYGPGTHDGINNCRHLQEATCIRLLCMQRWQGKALCTGALFTGAAPVEVCHLLHAKVVSCLGGPLQLFGTLADPPWILAQTILHALL